MNNDNPKVIISKHLPLTPSGEAVIEFQKIYKDEYGVEISHEEAVRKGGNLLNLFRLLSK